MGSRRRDRYIKWRGRIAHYYRRTPRDVQCVDGRRFVEKSLETDDPRLAEVRRDAINAAQEDLWGRYRAMGKTVPALKRHEAAVKTATALGFPYRTMADLLGAPDADLLKRLEAVATAPSEEVAADALLGTVERPELDMGEALEVF